jgi:uncharacterized iron-regulated membrane protein
MRMSGVTDDRGAVGADYAALDLLLPTVIAQRLAPPVLISPPSRYAPTWTAHSEADNRPVRSDLVLDGITGGMVSRTAFSQRPLLDRITGYGVAIHEGRLFPPLNQILRVFTALGLLTLSFSVVVLWWWRRRSVGVLGAPPAHAATRYPVVLMIWLIVLGIVLPLLGGSMLLVFLLEWACLRRLPRARHFLGLVQPQRS